MRQPRLVLRAVRYVASCRTVALPLSDAAGGLHIQRGQRARRGRGKWRPGHAILDIAETEDDYLKGSHRQALRTNVRRAQTDGFSCRLATPAEEEYRGVPTGEGHVMVVVGRESQPIAWASATIDGRWALLENQYYLTPDVRNANARYLLHCFLLRQLRQRGVRYLWVAGVFRVGSGMHYYQHLLGFETVNLRIVRAGRGQ